MFEFFCAYKRAKHPVGGEGIGKAWRLATEQTLPPEAMQFEDRPKQLLVALCWQLQILAGDGPFYLSCRSCQNLFGHASHSTAATWLSSLCGMGILKEVTHGTGIKATRYRYIRAEQKASLPGQNTP